MLGWDAAAMMPPGGAAARGDQLAVLAGLAHGQLTAPAVGDDLAEAEAPADRDWRRPTSPDAPCLYPRHRHPGRPGGGGSPRQLRLRDGLARGAAHRRFRPGRAASGRGGAPDPAAADAMAPALGLSPYDALMDGYQPGITAADVQPVFARYEAFLRRRPAAGAGAPGPIAGADAARRAVSRPSGRRRCAAGCRSGPGWTSPMRGWTAPPTRSAAAPRPTCASPPATTRRTRRRRSWACCTRPATRCTSAACPRPTPGSRSARRPAWARMRASR